MGLARPGRGGYSVRQDNGPRRTPGPARHTCWENKWHTSFSAVVCLAFHTRSKFITFVFKTKAKEEKKRRNCLVRGELKEIFPEPKRDNNLLCALCLYIDKKASNTDSPFSVWWKERRSNSIRDVLWRFVLEMARKGLAILDGRSINTLPSCDWKLSWMDISQRSCRKQTAGWIASHESVYVSAGCNNQTVRSVGFMCGRQSIKWEAGLKRSDYDLTFSSALKTPAAEILRMRCHLWVSQWMQTNKTGSLVWGAKIMSKYTQPPRFMYKRSY